MICTKPTTITRVRMWCSERFALRAITCLLLDRLRLEPDDF
jgi:hypothetical protein